MKENQKVYVKASYSAGVLMKISIICDSVMWDFVSDVQYYIKEEKSYFTDIDNDKIIVQLKGTNTEYELFLCNYNEIINYLH